MPYRVLSPQEQAIEAQRINDLPSVVKGIKQAEKLGLARKKQTHSQKIGKQILQTNLKAQTDLNEMLMQKIGTYYAWLRQKIQDPATPTGRKHAYGQMAKILESEFSLSALTDGSPFFKTFDPQKVIHPSKVAHAFCYVKYRI